MSWTPRQVVDALTSTPPRIFRVPNTTPPEYVTAESYLSGNVGAKLKEAEQAATLDEAFKQNVYALKAALPSPIPKESIAASLGASFVPAGAYFDFIRHLLPVVERWMCDIYYLTASATWSITWKASSLLQDSHHNIVTWGTSRCPAVDIIKHALQLRSPIVYDVDENGDRVKNIAETAAAQAKLADVREEWSRWWRNSSPVDAITAAYNARFNTHVPRRYDGSRLTFPGLAAEMNGKALTPRRHQTAGALRILERGDVDDSVLLTYKVGWGKSLASILGVYKRLSLGISRKAAFIVPSHTLGQWRDFWHAYFPAFADRVAVAEEADFTPTSRQDFLARCLVDACQVVVLTYEQWMTMPMSPRSFEAYVSREVDEVEAEMLGEVVEGAKRELKRRQAKLAKLKAKYEDKWKKLTAKASSPVTWEDMGFDVVVCDEFHLLKNDSVSTRMTNVSGLPRSESQRAFDARLKLHWVTAPELFGAVGVEAATKLHRRRRSDGYPASGKAIGLTGTSITNTLAEVWVMMRHLQPRLLRERGLWSFDAFAAVFTTPVVAVEMDATGRFRQATRLRWQNMPELQQLLSQCWDRAASAPELQRPDLATGRMQVVEVEGTAELREYIKQLAERADKIRRREVDPTVDNMLKVTHDGRVAGVFNGPPSKEWPSDRRTKIDAAADVAWSLYCRSYEKRGVVLVFCDLFTPKADSDCDVDALTPEERFMTLGVYGVLRDKLAAKGLRRDEIAFVHDATSSVERDELFAAVRAGRCRVLIGSTQKLATGVNVQDRVYGMVHVTVPWRPDWLEQADGRGRRDGNLWAKWGHDIHSVAVVTVGSYDVVSWQMIEQKASFISQIVNDEFEGRVADDVGDLVISANVAKAIALGDLRIVEKTQMEVELGQYRRSYRLWQEDERRRRRTIEELPREIADVEARITTLSAMQRCRDAVAVSDFSTLLRSSSLVDGDAMDTVTSRDEANRRVFVVAERLRSRVRGEVMLGQYRGMQLVLDFASTPQVVAQFKDVEAAVGYVSVADIVVKVVGDVFAGLDYQLAGLEEVASRWTSRLAGLRRRLDEVGEAATSWQGREAAMVLLARYETLCDNIAAGQDSDDGDVGIDRKRYSWLTTID